MDLSENEESGRYLEGTGSIVFDHMSKIAFACQSPRTDVDILQTVCKRIGYEMVDFASCDESGLPIYHTNVMMWIGTKAVGISLDSIMNDKVWLVN